MIEKIYSSPFRVYISLGLLACAGILLGFQLPISLFPNTGRPSIRVVVPYAGYSIDEFSRVYGGTIEAALLGIDESGIKVESLETLYKTDSASFSIKTNWGGDPIQAMRVVENKVISLKSQFPQDMRDETMTMISGEDTGFLAISIFSATRSADEVYEWVRPLLDPALERVAGADHPSLYNPSKKQLVIELDPLRMASFQVLPKDVSEAVQLALNSRNGGAITVGVKTLTIESPRWMDQKGQLSAIPIVSRRGQSIRLGDVAKVQRSASDTESRIFKTSGAPSVLVFATPKPGANIKKMSDDIVHTVNAQSQSWPKDIQYKVLVDPSEFIGRAVGNVLHEVFIAALFAVLVLFVFMGNIKNVATAAIEIPMSIVMAFILMWLSGIQINMISLAGLALSAGMNVDASVVVMENIFRHFENCKSQLNYQERLRLVCQAVREVRVPIIASTVASVVVFLPLAVTSELSYAILGDLAKTVVFSHSLSAIVALILVPTIRLQILSRKKAGIHASSDHTASSDHKYFQRIENYYVNALEVFLRSRKIQLWGYFGLVLCLIGAVTLLLPRIPREVIGTPDTDWLVLGFSTKGNTTVHQMEFMQAEIEDRILKKFGDKIQYTLSQINEPNRAQILSRLKDQSQLSKLWQAYQKEFIDTPAMQFYVGPYNPSELPIPDPPHLRVSVVGGDSLRREEATKQIEDHLNSLRIFDRVWRRPGWDHEEMISLVPKLDQWPHLVRDGSALTPFDIADISRTATQGRKVAYWIENGVPLTVVMRYPTQWVTSVKDLEAFPIGVGGKIIPLHALADVRRQQVAPSPYRQDGQDLSVVLARQDENRKNLAKSSVETATREIQKLISTPDFNKLGVTANFEDAQAEITEAMRQLMVAIGLSVLLIFLTMVFQLGDIVSSLLVLVSVPLGIIGVIVSLFIFQSSLSLNAALGVILLNGISVANSILLVNFLNRAVKSGQSPFEAASAVARARLRPILMTSLTTVLATLPIALGLGEGGKILQPLGIAVCGGLWLSMTLTLFVVPGLQCWHLNRLRNKGTQEKPVAGWIVKHEPI